MLCPEVVNFPPPKVMSSCSRSLHLDSVIETIKRNNFYRSVIITCPDEMHTPISIEEIITDDNEYYKIHDCPLTEFIDPNFIQNFVKNGKMYCLSAERNCITQNCVAITPDGVLTLHLLEYIFQTIGLEGIKRPLGFYEVNIHLKNLRQYDKIKQCLQKMENFDFYISWEPNSEDVCPSSIAKYFYDRDIAVTQETVQIMKLTPSINEVPSPKDVELDEMTEWIGMLAHEGDLFQKEAYISTYGQPDSNFALKTTRISLLIAKGFITPTVITNVCKQMSEYVASRELDNYWTCLSGQTHENSLWQWSSSSPCLFQAHDSSYNIYFTQDGLSTYAIGQIKYS